MPYTLMPGKPHNRNTAHSNVMKPANNILSDLGDLVLLDGSLIDAVLSMYWADYRKDSKKAKVHIGFDLNRGIPKKIFLYS